MNHPSYNRSLHRIAIATALATFPLIFMGGLVTTKGAGMSVPDWPNSYGYNMFLFPPNQWVGGILYEHTHRLMGTVVGFLSIVLALFAFGPARTLASRRRLRIATVITSIAAFVLLLILVVIKGARAPHVADVFTRVSHAFVVALGAALVLGVASLARHREPRRWLRWVCVGVLAAVIFQGVLGGLRVVLVELDLAVIHGCFAQAFFCFVAFVILATSRLWDRLANVLSTDAPTPVSERIHEYPDPLTRGTATAGRPTAESGVLDYVRPGVFNSASNFHVPRSFARLAVVAVAVVYLQLIIGATMRHYDAGLAIPDLPLHYGKVLPPTNDTTLAEANLMRANSGSPDLRPVTLTQIWFHVGHRAGAVLVTIVLGLLIWRSLRDRELHFAARNPALILIPLLLTQLTLGILTVLLHKPADIASLHVAVGALVLVTTFSLAVRAVIASRGAPSGVSAGHTGRAAVDRQNVNGYRAVTT
ncbi:COX15/CtaA family protein [Humisphaera borealis]|uniref:COX15/CtaA family protein n=1 Tax=Humisphaera borealis TaxID=2807512 RepID=A0A7M2X0V1_9BACT|nr:COX15/CtaA family protein [Humisphaera borealis]QOV91315.1 COX15/CtaA family protein [Humisphaera borealis]